jgi:hypothetical protein
MPIPSQNEFLVPFLETLRDGQPHLRGEIIFALGKRFNLTEDELNATSGQQYTVVNRVAWCDAYFNKAGFITKEPHPKDNFEDVFRITIVGQNQLNRHAKRITVGYLQSFYQGKVYRGAGSSDTTSDAELDLFERFNKLPEPFQAFHSITWVGQGNRTVGEIDFLVAHPDYGVLVMEVKGGEVSIAREGNTNVWRSRDHYGKLHTIGDPCAQAERSRRELGEYLRERNQGTGRFYWALFPAVAMPESQVDHDIRMDCHSDMFIDHRHLDDLPARLTHIFEHWQQHADGKNQKFGGQPAIDALIDALIPSRQLRPRIGDMFERERQKIEQLTEEQFQLLRFIQYHRRAAIVGGAGTGKTMLAIEKAQQLIEDGLRVLFLAYNRNIVEWIERALTDDLVTVSTYHAFVGKAQHLAGNYRSRNMGWDEFNEKAPDLLLDAAQGIRQDNPDALFDAIIVDEAQDFEDAMWIPIPDLLKDPDNGILYVFFDDNQRIYTQISNVPIVTDPFPLTRNCRNTQRIHTTLMPYAVMDTATTCNGPEGRDVELIPASDAKTAKKELQRLLHRLVNEENVPHNEIVVLTPQAQKRSMWDDDEILGNFILTWDMRSTMRMAVKVCTIYSFKGLESSVVILSELDKLYRDVAGQLLYVGLSRARNHAIVLGELPEPASVTVS